MLTQSKTHYEYGIFFMHTEDWNKAEAEFKKALRYNPHSDGALFSLGLTNYFMGNFKEAVSLYRQALSINPSSPEYFNNIAAAYAKLGEWDNVILYSQKAIEIPSYPNPEFAYYNIGAAYFNIGRYKEAAEALKKSIQKDPEYKETHLLLAKALIKLKNYNEAIDALKIAKDLQEKENLNDVDLRAEIEYYTALAHLGLGENKAALKAFQFVISNTPKHPLAVNSLEYLEKLKIP